MRSHVLAVAAILAAAGCGGPREREAPAPEAAPAAGAANAAEPAPATPDPRGAATPSKPELFDDRAGSQTVWEDFRFDADAEGAAPAKFAFARTGMGHPAKWAVRAVKEAPSAPQALVQEDLDPTDYRFPVAVADAPVSADARISAKVRMVSGEVDRAAGLVLRYVDADNYYVARANALEDNVMLFYVKEGKRIAIGVWNGKVTSGEWHAFEVVVKGDHLLVRWDGLPILDLRDATLTAAGKCGLWTKADSLTQFDDVRIEALTR